MAKTFTVIKPTAPGREGPLGLNTRTDPVRLQPGELAIATNVVINEQGRIDRRTGYSSLLRTGTHSLFSAGNYLLGAVDGNLCVIEANGATTTLRSGIQGTVRYCRLGDTVYYVTPTQTGKVTARVHSAWTAGTYVGPETDRQFYNPPAGQAIEIHSSRIYIAAGSVVWYSEPFAYDWFELRVGFMMFPERVTGLVSVVDGLWVLTLRDAYFVAGMNPGQDSALRRMPGAGAAEGTMIKVPGDRMLSGENSLESAMWCGKAIFAGGPEGQLLNISGSKLVLPAAQTGAAYYHNDRAVFVLHTN
jgi:hypothetical protein